MITYISLSDLPGLGADLVEELRKAGFPPLGTSLATQQVLCVAEEAGEFVGAYRRWAGMARRSGSFRDVEDELADVVITSFVAADAVGVDLPLAIERKVTKIYTRGWRDPA